MEIILGVCPILLWSVLGLDFAGARVLTYRACIDEIEGLLYCNRSSVLKGDCSYEEPEYADLKLSNIPRKPARLARSTFQCSYEFFFFHTNGTLCNYLERVIGRGEQHKKKDEVTTISTNGAPTTEPTGAIEVTTVTKATKITEPTKVTKTTNVTEATKVTGETKMTGATKVTEVTESSQITYTRTDTQGYISPGLAIAIGLINFIIGFMTMAVVSILCEKNIRSARQTVSSQFKRKKLPSDTMELQANETQPHGETVNSNQAAAHVSDNQPQQENRPVDHRAGNMYEELSEEQSREDATYSVIGQVDGGDNSTTNAGPDDNLPATEDAQAPAQYFILEPTNDHVDVGEFGDNNTSSIGRNDNLPANENANAPAHYFILENVNQDSEQQTAAKEEPLGSHTYAILEPQNVESANQHVNN